MDPAQWARVSVGERLRGPEALGPEVVIASPCLAVPAGLLMTLKDGVDGVEMLPDSEVPPALFSTSPEAVSSMVFRSRRPLRRTDSAPAALSVAKCVSSDICGSPLRKLLQRQAGFECRSERHRARFRSGDRFSLELVLGIAGCVMRPGRPRVGRNSGSRVPSLRQTRGRTRGRLRFGWQGSEIDHGGGGRTSCPERRWTPTLVSSATAARAR
jgi:hypothetical protein